MTKILLSGCNGHMGQVIVNCVNERSDASIVSGVDINSNISNSFPVYSNINDVSEKADVIIDFSHPSVLDSILAYSIKTGTPVVLCTTGYTDDQVNQIKKLAETVPVFYSRNMSIGINLLIELAKKATSILGSQFNIEIIEKHHNQKIDAPSGTALMIADAVNDASDCEMNYVFDRQSVRKKREPNEIGIHSIRGGTIVGEHEVLFAGHHETISLTHTAQTKDVFAVGAINAAVYLKTVSNPGLYNMSDLINN